MASPLGLLVHVQKITKQHHRKRETRAYDVVAVHGLGGNRAMSWSSYGEHEGSEMWLNDTLPTILDRPRIMTFDYELNSRCITVAGIHKQALDLLESLEDKRKEAGVW
ncbi:hypothetical protein ANO14919_121740 [Xylariales sp. No.14919]|nr:hypothetical protein ANO14919_121740 [Xylariales sp. No.14919]